jgi:hypothetical protein
MAMARDECIFIYVRANFAGPVPVPLASAGKTNGN